MLVGSLVEGLVGSLVGSLVRNLAREGSKCRWIIVILYEGVMLLSNMSKLWSDSQLGRAINNFRSAFKGRPQGSENLSSLFAFQSIKSIIAL